VATRFNDKYEGYSEQDTVDTLILPYLSRRHRFPKASSLDYQAQHTVPTALGGTGRYDGLYLSGGYPYVVMEGKRYAHDLTDADVAQARSYATSAFFDRPVPFLVVSNGREHRFLQITTTIDPTDGKPEYAPIPAVDWKQIVAEDPGEVRQMLSEAQLLGMLRSFKSRVAQDVSSLFHDPATQALNTSLHPLGAHLDAIITSRRTFLGETAKGSSEPAKRQNAIQQAIEGVALHFTIKILFIKLIEDLARGGDSLRIIHTLFPQRQYDQIGGLFGYKLLAGLDGAGELPALRTFARSRAFYRRLGTDIARVSWADIFRYGFSANMSRYGQLFQARDYDRFMPSERTLEEIRLRLVEIDIRTAVIYGSAAKRSNVIGDLYEKLISNEIRTGLGAVYTPDETMRFMVDLSSQHLGGFVGHKIVEPACGSGHFYREIYRRYVDEVLAADEAAGRALDARKAHSEALRRVYGRDIDPFAVQLTLLSTFLEQLKDSISPDLETDERRVWLADRSVDTQNSLDPVTVHPDAGFDIHKTADLGVARNLRASAKRALDPDLMIGNPPYGVKVIEGPGYDSIYDLQSKDSYGYFIANALARLPEGRRMVYIVSSSFLTIGSHRKLRENILRSAKIIRLVKLHRSTFPGIDTFPVIVELERCSDANGRQNHNYQFYDLWRFHPQKDKEQLASAYAAILADPHASEDWPFASDVARRYQVRQGIIGRYRNKPIFEGRPSLYDFMADMTTLPIDLKLPYADGQVLDVRAQTIRDRYVVRLSGIASVKIGLQSGNNKKFYRTAPGASGGAAKGGYGVVNLAQVVSESTLTALTAQEKAHGIEVNDPAADRFWVPLDKAGIADIENGLLAEFWRPVEFYVNWSSQAVGEMRTLKGARFQNSENYFEKGISFSNTGIYSPTYRLGHGGVFDQKGSNIFCGVLEREVLLGILSSTLLRYFAKSFINHGVDTQIEDLPIAIPDEMQAAKIKTLVKQIVAAQQSDINFDYRSIAAEIDDVVDDLYVLTADEKTEIRTWHRRHYPKLH
jgi:hypothetical protein